MKKNNSPDWIRYAETDLMAAKELLKSPFVLKFTVCFHAQQCAEKAIKGVIVSFNQQPPRIHDIDPLLDRLAKIIQVDEEIRQADELTKYSTQPRYPGDWPEISQTEADEAIEIAEQVLQWCKKHINK